jgi:hypothetical protein
MKREIHTPTGIDGWSSVKITKWGSFFIYMKKVYPILLIAGIAFFFVIQSNVRLKHEINVNNKLVKTYQEKIDSILEIKATESLINIKSEIASLKNDNEELRSTVQKSQLYIRELTNYYNINDKILLKNRRNNIITDILIPLITGLLVHYIPKKNSK